MNKCILLIFASIFTFLVDAYAQTLTVSVLTTGLNRPVSITNSGLPNDNRLFVCEKVGRIRIIDRNTGVMNVTPFLNMTNLVYSTGNEQGLLGLAFHPDYASNGFFYVFYNHRVGATNYTRLARYQVSNFADTAIYNSGQVMMTVYHPFTNHNGGNLMFGKDGYLYVSMGDGGSSGDPANRAQNCDSLLGKILRLDVNNPNPPYYFSPASNPFYGGNIPPQTYIGTAPGRDEIYAWGMRNPWRCSIDRLTGDKWIADVGQNAWEEIDFESRSDSFGHNYGWRCYEGNAAYNTGGCQPATSYTPPVYTYPQGADCSVTGGFVYRGGQEGSMFGKYFFADYCSGKIWKTFPNGSGWTTNVVPQTNPLFTNKFTAWGEDTYGELYLGGDGTAGVIYKIVDTSCSPTAHINAPDTVLNCSGNAININAIHGTGLNYNWYIDGISVSSSSASTYSYAYNPGCHTVHVVVTGICPATSNTIVVCNDTIPFPSVGTTVTNATICAGTNTSITGTGATTYTWEPGSLSGTTVTVSPAATTIYTVTGTNAAGCIQTATRLINVLTCSSTLNLKLYLQGYYAGAGLMAPVLTNQGVPSNNTMTDTIEVQLRNTTFPYTMVAMIKTILNINGNTTCTFPPLNGTYYIVVKHRNTIETWSSNGIAISTTTAADFDFSTSQNMAYGGNQILVSSSPNVFALYSGDLNTDENIDLLDISILETDINAFQFGYWRTDINGDGNVDLLDSPVLENNISSFIFSNHP